MGTRRKRFALFDLDGTLLDTEPLYTRGIDLMLEPYGHRMTVELKRRMMGRSTAEATHILIETLGLPVSADQYSEDRDPIMFDLMRNAPEIPGATVFVSALAELGIHMAIATSSPRKLTMQKLGDNPIAGFFAATVCGDEVQRLKPAPDVFLEAARQIGADPGQTIVFEDSESGIAAARAAGMDVVVIAHPEYGPQDLSNTLLSARDFNSLSVERLFG